MNREHVSSNHTTHELRNRLFITLSLIALYLIGRSIIIYGVDLSAYGTESFSSDAVILSMVSGDRNRCSLLALGIMPYIISSLLVSFFLALGGKSLKSQFTPTRTEKYTFICALILSIFFSFSRAAELIFKDDLLFSRNLLVFLAFLQMLAGALIVFFLVKMNKDHGICGQSVFIAINVLDSICNMLSSSAGSELIPIVVLCVVIIILMLLIERANYKMQVQRVSIHSSNSNNSFIEFKLNPIGIMPVMFAASFLMIPRQFFNFLSVVWSGPEDSFPNKETFYLMSEKFVLTDKLGVVVYLFIILLLAILFSFVLLSPSELADNLQTGGDSIVNIYAGTRTRNHISKVLFLLSVFSGVFLSTAMGIPLFISLHGNMSTRLAMLPSSVLILTNLICNILREIQAYRRYDSYEFFM